ARAATLYGGPLLAGIHVPDAPEFDAWVGRERSRLERQFLEICERHVRVLMNAGQWNAATALAERWVETAPRSTAAAGSLGSAHAGQGTAAALTSAVNAYDRIRALLAGTHGVAIDASITTLAATIRDQLSVIPGEPPLMLGSPFALPSESSVVTTNTRGATRATKRWPLIALASAAAAVVIAVWTARRPSVVAAEAKLPIVAVTSIDDVRGDSSLDWLRAGLPRMIATDLG